MADIYGSEVYDVPRQHSSCRILVYSHISEGTEDKTFTGAVDCSRDVIQCDTSKTLKSGGGASFVLVPRRNYLNFIYPNDHVHIYFDPGDGRGFIKTFFGLVDRIDRSISVGGNGESTTRFVITCSDFTKAFDKTNIYFNPQLSERGDFVSQHFMGTKNIAGSAMRAKGLSIYGTPADIVMSLCQLTLGFGAQFTVPESYPDIGIRKDISRKVRFKNLLTMLAKDFQEANSPEELERIKSEVESATSQLSERSKSESLDALSEKIKFAKSSVLGTLVSEAMGEQTSLTPAAYQKVIAGVAALYDSVNDPLFTSAITEGKTIYGTGTYLVDMIDFRFMETAAIDGAIMANQIWQSQGPLWSIMNAWSNGEINELFCDLRPVGADLTNELTEGAYYHFSDELDANTDSSAYYVPAIIMREHPFATVESVVPSTNVSLFSGSLGVVHLGGLGDEGIWSKSPGKAGRKISTITAINPYRRLVDPNAQAIKHLDVCVISVQDIINERIGRSDADVTNLIEVYADMGMGATGKYMESTIQPISNPVSIIRDGLRVRTYITKFARWPSNDLHNSGMDSAGARFLTIRWALLLDHWYQHNKEYLNGTFTTRAFPEIRVGYRLDIKERDESYYVEGVTNNWVYSDKGGMLTTSLTVSRGQRNDPYPVYVLPALVGWGGIDNRDTSSRLARYFDQKNPSAVTRSSVIVGDSNLFTDQYLQNLIDLPSKSNTWLKNLNQFPAGYLSSGAIPSVRVSDETLEDLQGILEKIEEKSKEKSLAIGTGSSFIGSTNTPSISSPPPKTGGTSSNT